MDPARYAETIRVCALQRDLTLLLAGDLTEIGERGSNLSGGQKQRVSLARAVYNDSEIIVLDDPLSAVDQHVGQQIFNECIKGFLKDRAVVIAMHQLQYLPQADLVVLIKNGRIEHQGKYEDLINQVPSFAHLIENHVSGGEEGNAEEVLNSIHAEKMKAKEAAAVKPQLLVKPEDVSMIFSKESSEQLLTTTNQATIQRQTLQETILAATLAASQIPDLPQLSVADRNQLTVRSMMPQAHAILADEVAEAVERNQLSILKDSAGDTTRSMHNVADIIRQNELTVYSDSHVQGTVAEHEAAKAGALNVGANGENEAKNMATIQASAAAAAIQQLIPSPENTPAQTAPAAANANQTSAEDALKKGKLVGEDESSKTIGARDYYLYLISGEVGTGAFITILTILFFFMVHGVRLGSGELL
jgi:energy-coupling factor transporter ATP-binding protein EcfA2